MPPPMLPNPSKDRPKSDQNCLRFAYPAEADWRLEVGKPAPRYLGSIQLWNSGSLELWNGVE